MSLETCSDPSINSNAIVIGSEFYDGKEVEFDCQKDAILIPKSSRKVTCRNGRWSSIIPLCKGKTLKQLNVIELNTIESLPSVIIATVIIFIDFFKLIFCYHDPAKR